MNHLLIPFWQSLPSVIQTLLDSGELRFNIILCGSSQTMMYNLTHDEASPLYGRKEADFNIGPIRLPYLQEALGLSAEATIENYAVWGGIPRYWKLRKESLDKKHILVGECKWTAGENGRLLTNEIRKIADVLPFTANRQVDIVLFTKTLPEEDMGNSILPDKVIEMNY